MAPLGVGVEVETPPIQRDKDGLGSAWDGHGRASFPAAWTYRSPIPNSPPWFPHSLHLPGTLVPTFPVVSSSSLFLPLFPIFPIHGFSWLPSISVLLCDQGTTSQIMEYPHSRVGKASHNPSIPNFLIFSEHS